MLKVELIGNLGADAQVKDANGAKFVTMRVAHTDKWTDAQGNQRSATTWVDVTYNNPDAKVVQFLKAGVKLFIRGNASLRVYSSAKDRCMKAGLTIAAIEIELCGGSTDDVPRELIDPNNGTMYKVAKYYQSGLDTSKWKKEDQGLLVDKQSHRYIVVKGGWVAPEVVQPEDDKDNLAE